jgi:hypothetical protein
MPRVKKYNVLSIKKRHKKAEKLALKELARLSFDIAMSKLNDSQKSDFTKERINPNLIKDFSE